MKPSFESRYSDEIKLFRDVYLHGRDVKEARAALEQRNVHPRLINKVADFVISSMGGQSNPFSGGQRSITGVREEEDDVADIQKRAGIDSSLTRRDAHKRTMQQLDDVMAPLARLASLAHDAEIPLETIVEEIREIMIEMYAKKKERVARKPEPEPFDP